MITKIKQIWGKTDDVLQNYAFILLAALLTAASTVSLIQQENTIIAEAKFNLLKMAFTSALGISLFFALNMLAERIGKKILLNLAGVIFLILYFLFVFPKTEKNFTENYAHILLVSFLLTHLLVAFIAFFRKNDEISFWQYNKNLFINIVLTAIFTGVLVGGILLAIAAVDNLFDFNFNQKIYPQTFVFFAIFGSSFIFLLFNEEGLKFLEKNGAYPEILKFFVQFILIPLLLIYVVILYFYGIKILLNWNLPRGWVSYLIMAYSLVGIFALLLVYPLKEIMKKSWIKIFHKIFYYSLIPLIVLLFVAIKTRILAYGFTENRYYVLLLAIWLSIVVLYFIFCKKPNIKFIPISLFIFGLFSLAIPHFNAFSVSKRSQKIELQEILNKNNLLENGKINFKKPVKDSVADEISNKFQFLNDRKEATFLMNYIPDNEQTKFKKILEEDRYLVYSKLRTNFKNIQNTNKENANFRQLIIISEKKDFDVKDYDYLFLAKRSSVNKFEFDGNILEFKMNDTDSDMNFKFNNKAYNNFDELIKIAKANENSQGETYAEDVSVNKIIENYDVKFIFEGLIYNKPYNSERKLFLYGNQVLILVKKK